MWMNESEIDRALEIVGQYAPEFLPYVKYLSDWRDIINRNSDGWPYWSAGTRPSGTLQELVTKLMNSIQGRGGGGPSAREFDKSLTPIKSFATRKNLPAPVLGGESAPSSGPVLERDDMKFVKWSEESLVPLLKKNGDTVMSENIGRLVRIIKALQ
jgi:hypothetical protein